MAQYQNSPTGLRIGSNSWTSPTNTFHIFAGYITGSGNYIDIFIPYNVDNINDVSSVTLGSSAVAYTPNDSLTMNNATAVSCAKCIGGVFAEFQLPSTQSLRMVAASLRTSSFTIVCT